MVILMNMNSCYCMKKENMQLTRIKVHVSVQRIFNDHAFDAPYGITLAL